MPRTKAFNEEEVLDKALQLFWCCGYHGTSMQDLVTGLGINRSSMYDTFGDKHALFLAALERYRTQAAGALLTLINESPSIKATLTQLFETTVQETFTDPQSKGCFMVNSAVELGPHDAQIAALIKVNNQVLEEAFYQATQKAQKTGEVSLQHDARALARFFMNTINGLRVAAKANPDRQVFDDVIKVALSVLEVK